MNGIMVFNPEHDLALANGDRNFIAPKNIREMASDLAPLLDVMGGEQIVVWGWDGAVKQRLLRLGVAEELLPTDGALASLRKCSERKSAHRLLRAFHADHPEGPYAGESIVVHDIDEAAAYATLHGHIVLKDPLSSSGKGLRHVNMFERSLPLSRNCTVALLNADKTEVVATDASFASAQRGETSKSSEQIDGGTSATALKKVESWANALIGRYGYFTAEPYYEKVQDFAMEFCVNEKQCSFIGYSLFNTNAHGRYEGNCLMSDERIESLLSHYVPCVALREVQEWVVKHHDCIIPIEWDTTKHPLYFGIDMMVVRAQFTIHNSQFTIDKQSLPDGENFQFSIFNSQFKLHPCVEINLRLNMGIIAHEVYRKLLAPGVEGSFHVSSFPTSEETLRFHKECREHYPVLCQEGKIVSGYYPLTPITSHTCHHAYIMCG